MWGLLAACASAACSFGPAKQTGPAEPIDHATADWNDTAIDWKGFEAGLSEAAARNKPVLLVFYTTWCPHCHNLSWLFHDPRLVSASTSFVMIRLDRDQNPEISKRFDLDGDYIPRVFVLDSQGAVRAEITPHDQPQFRYFPDEYDAGELLSMMKRATP